MRSLILIALCTFYFQSTAQLSSEVSSLKQVSVLDMPALDNASLKQKEINARRPGRPISFAQPTEVSISPQTHGHWEYTRSNQAVWRMRITSKDAYSINLGFDLFNMPLHGNVYLYDLSKEIIFGPFNSKDNEIHKELWSPIISSDEIVIELQMPMGQEAEALLHLKWVNHAFIDLNEKGAESGSCNLDVVCSEADGWPEVDPHRDIIRSVGWYTLNGNNICTGFLVNNVREDCYPYFMTANHCGVRNNNDASMVVYWNYENSTCRQPGSSQSGQNGNGNLNVFNSGSNLLSRDGNSDFTLVELDDEVVEDANAYFAGWDVRDAVPNEVIAIHHPALDEKRISFEYDPSFITTYLNYASDPNGTHIMVEDWDIGTTEGGSSGSPLYDSNERVVGQLHGGFAACGNDDADWYGRMFLSWDGNGTPDTRLKDWLDPDDTGTLFIDGREAGGCAISIVPDQFVFDLCTNTDANFTILVGTGFSGVVNLDATGLPAGVTLTFSQDPAPAGSTITAVIDVSAAAVAGSSTISIEGVSGTDVVSFDITLVVQSAMPTAPMAIFPLDESQGVITVPIVVWDSLAGAHHFQLASDQNMTNIIFEDDALVNNMVQVSGLNPMTDYYWRVREENSCGQGPWSAVFKFTTAGVTCSNEFAFDIPVTIPSNGSNTVSSTINISQSGAVTDINLWNITGQHSFLGDLDFRLRSPAGTLVTLISQNCFNEDDFNISFDDSANSATIPCPYNDGQVYQPVGSLSDFIGEDAAGAWTLEITDNADLDGGVLQEWDLEICSVDASDVSISTPNNMLNYCEGLAVDFSIDVGSGFSASGVNLSSPNLPMGASISFSSNPAAPGATVDCSITNLPAGMHSVSILGTDGQINSSLVIDVTVGASAAVAGLIAPADGMTGLDPQSIMLEFGPQVMGNDYVLEVALDAAFTNVVYTNPETCCTATVPALQFSTTYYWRITSSTDCGSIVSDIFSFSTVPDLSILLDPDSIVICKGDNGFVTIVLGDGFESSGVDLSSSFANVSFNPNPTSGGSTVTMTLFNTQDLNTGWYNVDITVSDSQNSMPASLAVFIQDDPSSPALIDPTDMQSNVDTMNVTFNWSSTPGESYDFRLSEDPGFVTIIDQATVNTGSYTSTVQLMGNRAYYWSVEARNSCGMTISMTSSFTTLLIDDIDPVLAQILSLRPNPAKEHILLQFARPLGEEIHLEVYNLEGKSVLQEKLAANLNQHYIYCDDWISGLYLLRFRTKQGIYTKRLIKQ